MYTVFRNREHKWDSPRRKVHEEDRRSYYAALESWDLNQALDPLRIFLEEQTVKTWEKQLRRKQKGI